MDEKLFVRQAYQKIKPTGIAAFVVFIITFGVYFTTLAPTYTWAHFGFDAGDLLTAIQYWGVPHPPGFPIYIMIGKLFSLLPIGNLAFRLNLMSAVFGSLTCVIVYFTLTKLTKSITISAISAFVLAFSYTFWSQSLITEVYTLNSFFTALLLFLGLLTIQSLPEMNRPKTDRLIFMTVFIYGLSLTNHLTTIFFGSSLLLILFWRLYKNVSVRQSIGYLVTVICIFLIGLLPYLYIYLRAQSGTIFNWGDPSTPARFINYISGREFQHFIQASGSAIDLTSRFFVLLNRNITLIGIIAATVGAVLLFQERKKFLIYSFIPTVLLIIFNINYKIDNIETFYLPVYVGFIIWMGYGLHTIAIGLRAYIAEDTLFRSTLPLFVFSRVPISRNAFTQITVTLSSIFIAGITLLALCIPTYLLVRNYSEVSLHSDYSAENFAYSTFRAMDQVAPSSQKKVLIPEEAETTFALRYYRFIDFKNRDDVIFFMTNGVYDSDDNLAFFREKYPELHFPDYPTGISVKSNSQGLMMSIQANWDKYNYFYAKGLPFPRWGLEQQIELEDGVIFSSVGPIYRIHPKGPFD